uniref:Uncharacterized protein n=1 Tax=Anguilla anguilla TaxID=7936 RepID=A0A0E9TH38_ANGAN
MICQFGYFSTREMTTCDPMKPAPPVTRTVLSNSFLELAK